MEKEGKAMKLNKLLVGILVICIAAGCLSACSGSGDSGTSSSGSGETYSFSFTIHDPSTSVKTQFYEDLAETTKEATDGAVDITVYSGGTLVASTDVAEAILADTADIGWLFTGFFVGQFPITDAMTLPMIFDDSVIASEVFNDLFENSEDLQEELSDYKVLGVYCAPITYIYTVDTTIESLDDISGLTLRSPAGVCTDIVTDWGASPISMGPSDLYESIEKGVIDGFLLDWSGVKSYTLQEVVDYCIEIPVNVGVFMVVMNKEKWESLPEEYQEIMDELWGREASIDIAELYVEDANDAIEAAEELGVEFIEPTDEAYAEFESVAEEYVENWIAENTTDTFDAQAYYDLLISYRDSYYE